MTLLNDIYAYLRRTGISKTYFGKVSVNNSALVKRLESGRPVLSSTDARLRGFMRDNPKGTPRRRDETITDSADSGDENDPEGKIGASPEQPGRLPQGNSDCNPQNIGVASAERSRHQTKNPVKEEPPPDGFE